MAIDPKLVSIVSASDLPTGDPTSAGQFFFFEGNEMQKAPMTNIYDKVTSGITGEATQSNAPGSVGFERWIVSTPLTLPNSWGFEVTQAELDENLVFFNVTDGVVSKELSGKLVADPAKLPLYSEIKNADIVAGTQFIDDENGNVQYRVKTGQTLLTSELPANVVGTKVEIIGVSNKDIATIDSALFTTIPKDVNAILELVGSDVNNTELWGVGFLRPIGTVQVDNTWRYSLKYYPINAGKFNLKIGVYGNGAICFYDENKVFISAVLKGSSDTGTYFINTAFDVPINAHYVRISHSIAYYSTTEIYFKTAEVEKIPKSDVFIEANKLPENVVPIVAERLENHGLNILPINTEFLTELVGSSLTDETLWASGFYRSTGTVSASESWFYTVKKYPLKGGATYKIDVNISGNAVALILNLDGTVRKALIAGGSTDTGSGFGRSFTETIETDALFVTSQNTDNVSLPTTERLSVKNITEIYDKALTTETLKDYLPEPSTDVIRQMFLDKYRPKKKRPLVTIISDDGSTQNLDWFVPILDEFKAKATFSIIGDRTRYVDLGLGSAVISSDGLRDLYNDGHDIAAHTWTHTRNWSTIFTAEQIEEEMSRTKVFLEQITQTPVNMFISPFGERTPDIDNIISKYYDANFISGYGSLNAIPLDNYFINRVSFDSSETDFTQLWDSTLKPAIDEAILNDSWVVFAIHPHYTQYYGSNPNHLARRDELRTLLQYCLDNEVEVTTAKKGYEYFKNFVNIGVRRYDSKVYQMGMDGSEYNLNYFVE